MKKNTLFRKGIAFAIIVVLIGTNIVPIVIGVIKEKDNVDVYNKINDEIETINYGNIKLSNTLSNELCILPHVNTANGEDSRANYVGPTNLDNPFFDVHEIGDFGQTAWGATSADFNDDSNMDFAVSYATSPWWYSTISLFYNDGNLEFTQDDVFTFSYSYISDLDSGDYDNDGDIDLMFTYSEYVYYQGYHVKVNGTVNILYNDGENNFGNETMVAFHGGGYVGNPENRINPQLSSADYDMDGDIDFLVGDNSGKIEFYKNNGSGNFTSAGIIHDFGHTSWGVTSADYDGDGDIDFLVAAETEIGSDYGHVYLKRNKMVESNYSICFEPGHGEIIFDYSVYNSGSLTSLDYNKDGDIEFIIGFGASMYLCMKKENFYEPFRISSPNGTGDLREGGLTTADYDKDGYDDLVVGGSNGVVRVFINSRCHAVFTRPRTRYWYKFDEEQYPIFKDEGVLAIGKLTVEVKELEEIEKVEFYVDRWLRETDTTPPYSFSWTWRPILLFKIRHTLKIVAYDSDGNHSSKDEIFPVWRFL